MLLGLIYKTDTVRDLLLPPIKRCSAMPSLEIDADRKQGGCLLNSDYAVTQQSPVIWGNCGHTSIMRRPFVNIRSNPK